MIPRSVINERHPLMKAGEVKVCPFCLLPLHPSDGKLHVTVHKPNKEEREAEGTSLDDLVKMHEDS